MMVSRYQPILYLQYLLLLVDLVLNSFTEMLRFENVILLIMFVIQDICILFAVIVVFLLFFNTYIFQAGLVNILVNKFRLPICVTFIYFMLNVGLHVWGMVLFDSQTLRWDDPDKYIWDVTGYRVLFIIQRTVAILYYYFYKRTALKLGDPRFYQDSEWIRREFEKRR
ncbi:transmembrane protein 138-like isoform X1 [Haliotis rubra]|uniref:transmembrane protein 138-like isoform X1 n=1 Tax=Haliotis rubra TaxID=36100 RepID=UPI001EE5FBE1|nr:transmembrane protein 138-like isoform X1 [Haliotis rubra]